LVRGAAIVHAASRNGILPVRAAPRSIKRRETAIVVKTPADFYNEDSAGHFVQGGASGRRVRSFKHFLGRERWSVLPIAEAYLHE